MNRISGEVISELPLVSIIVPIYNTEKYLNECIGSVTKQTYDKIQIILVDDGSTDSSPLLCDKYASEDMRIEVIHKDNGGLSDARNKGLKRSRGEYVFFVDSDDFLPSRCIEQFVYYAMLYDSDITIMKMQLVFSEDDIIEPENDSKNVTIFNSEQAIEESLYQKKYSCCATSKLYKKRVVSDIMFPVGKLAEDLATCHLFFDNASKIIFVDEVDYYYRQQNKSILHTWTPQRLDVVEFAEDIVEYCKKKHPHIINAAYCRLFNVSVHCLLDLPSAGSCHDLYSSFLWEKIKKTRLIVLKDMKARGREKIAAILSFWGEGILRSAWNSKFAIKRKEQ